MRLRYSNFSAGLLEDARSRSIPDGFTPDAQNVDIERDGSITLPGRGVTRFTSSPLAAGKPVRGLWWLQRKDGTWAILAACDNKLWRIKASGDAESLGTLYGGVNTHYSGQVYLGQLFICSGQGSPQVYNTELEDLADLEDVDLPPTWKAGNWPSKVTLLNAGKNERLCMFAPGNDTSALWTCAYANHLAWNLDDDGYNLAPGDGDGEELIAVASFHDLVICIKETRSFALHNIGTDGLPEAMNLIPFGGDSQESVVSIDNALYWSSPEGFVSLAAALEPGADARGTFSSRRIPDALGEISQTRRRQICGAWDHKLRRVRWFAPDLKDVTNNRVFDFYPYHRHPDHRGLTTGAWMTWKGIQASAVISYESAMGPIMLAGDYDGYINRVGFNHLNLGESIPAHFTLPTIELGYRGRIPIMDWLVHEGGDNLQVETAIDSGEAKINYRTLEPTFSGETAPARARLVNFGGGHDFQFTIRHRGGAEPGRIDGLVVEAQPLGGR